MQSEMDCHEAIMFIVPLLSPKAIWSKMRPQSMPWFEVSKRILVIPLWTNLWGILDSETMVLLILKVNTSFKDWLIDWFFRAREQAVRVQRERVRVNVKWIDCMLSLEPNTGPNTGLNLMNWNHELSGNQDSKY